MMLFQPFLSKTAEIRINKGMKSIYFVKTAFLNKNKYTFSFYPLKMKLVSVYGRARLKMKLEPIHGSDYY